MILNRLKNNISKNFLRKRVFKYFLKNKFVGLLAVEDIY